MLGDSLVAGVGDKRVEGGYVSRAQAQITEAQFHNYGVPGETALQLVRKLQKAFAGRGRSALARELKKADVVFIDTGRNDHWLHGSPLATYRNLKRARVTIEDSVRASTSHKPLVVTAVLMHPNRRFQEPWVSDLDDLLLRSNSTSAPANLRFDRISKSLLSSDNIHPTGVGYSKMAQVLVSYLLEILPRYIRALRPDRDADGLYDEYEAEVYGCDPKNPDTDGDGLKDGEDPQPTVAG